MRHISLGLLASAGFLTLLFTQQADAGLITFGSGVNQFDMEFVEIGDAGNLPDATGAPNPAGAVPYIYNMGKFEVSRDMITKANRLGSLGITMFDMSPYGGNGVDRPATGVNWNQAARFVNWLNTSEGYAPAYKFALQPGDGGYNANANIELWTSADTLDYDASNPFRSLRANYVLPSVDEWYKAAYYDPLSDTYFDYPNGSDLPPTAVASGTTANTAVYNQTVSQGPADIMDAGGLSPFGIMALGGNVYEWEETSFDLSNSAVSSARGVRGGLWGSSFSLGLSSSFRNLVDPDVDPDVEVSFIGFRVASLSSPATVPEPGSLVVWSAICVGGLCYRRRRVRK